jgi:hypothetical protein
MKENLLDIVNAFFVLIFFTVITYCLWQAHDTSNRAIELCYSSQSIPTVSYD